MQLVQCQGWRTGNRTSCGGQNRRAPKRAQPRSFPNKGGCSVRQPLGGGPRACKPALWQPVCHPSPPAGCPPLQAARAWLHSYATLVRLSIRGCTTAQGAACVTQATVPARPTEGQLIAAWGVYLSGEDVQEVGTGGTADSRAKRQRSASLVLRLEFADRGASVCAEQGGQMRPRAGQANSWPSDPHP